MKVQFSRCTSSNLDKVPVTDGQIIFVKDTNEQYLDTDATRAKITDLVFIPDLEALYKINNPLSNKLYYVVAENLIQFYCNGKWQAINYVNIENILTKDNETPYTPTKDYHPATKKYVDDLMYEEQSKTYMKSFTDGDWVLNGQDYILTIPQSEHLLASPYVLSLDMLDNEEFKSVAMYGSKLLPNGSLLILSDLKYTGRILLKGGI